jgi:hypothetical protein
MTRPMSIAKGINMIWDMPIFQKNSRRVTTCVFWIRMIMNRAAKTSKTIIFGFIINPWYLFALLLFRRLFFADFTGSLL